MVLLREPSRPGEAGVGREIVEALTEVYLLGCALDGQIGWRYVLWRA